MGGLGGLAQVWSSTIEAQIQELRGWGHSTCHTQTPLLNLTPSKTLLTIAVGQFVGRSWLILEPRKRAEQATAEETRERQEKAGEMEAGPDQTKEAPKGPLVRMGSDRMRDERQTQLPSFKTRQRNKYSF